MSSHTVVVVTTRRRRGDDAVTTHGNDAAASHVAAPPALGWTSQQGEGGLQVARLETPIQPTSRPIFNPPGTVTAAAGGMLDRRRPKEYKREKKLGR